MNDWPKRVNNDKGLQVKVIERITKVMWRVYTKQALIVLEILKKEAKDKLLWIFTQKGAMFEWEEKQEKNLVEVQMELIQ